MSPMNNQMNNSIRKSPLKKHGKKVLAIAVVAAIAATGAFLYLGTSKQSTQYQTSEAKKESLISSLSVSGNVFASNQAAVVSTTTGVVDKVYVKNGDKVKRGDELFRVKSTVSDEERASAYATYQNALNSLAIAQQNKLQQEVQILQKKQMVMNAENELNKMHDNPTDPQTREPYTDLEIKSKESALTQAKKDLEITQDRYEEADPAVDAARAQVESARLAYNESEFATITAPAGGTVVNLAVFVGDYVTASGGSSSSSGGSSGSSGGGGASGGLGSSNGSASSGNGSSSSPLLYIGNFSKLMVKASVNEIDLPKLKVGQKATITLDAFPGKTFAGKVSQLDKVGTNSSGVVTYSLNISFISPPANLASQMTATANIQIARKDGVIAVLSSAIQKVNGQSMVRVLNSSSQVERKTVVTGLTSDTATEIVSGLKEGEKVVTATLSSTSGGTSGSSPFSGGFRPGAMGGSAGRRD